MAFLFLLSLCFCHLNSWVKKYLFVDFFLLSCSPAWRVSWICKLSLNIIVPLSKYTISCMVACSMLTHKSLSLCLFPLFCLFFSLGIIINLFSIVPFFFFPSGIWHVFFAVFWTWGSPYQLQETCALTFWIPSTQDYWETPALQSAEVMNGLIYWQVHTIWARGCRT